MPTAKQPNLGNLVYFADSPIHGRGAFAKVDLKRGQYIGTYAGPVAKRNGRYVLWLTDEGGGEVGIRGLNVLRYLNHSKRPNACFDGPDLYAKLRIQADQEITFDYGWKTETE